MCLSGSSGGGGWGFCRQGRYGPLSALHLLLIALVLRLRVSPWSLMHMRNNVFACSHALCMAREEATVLWWTLCPRSCIFFSCSHLCICLCVSWFAFSHTVKSTLYQAPLLLLESNGALDNKQRSQCRSTGHWGLLTVWQRLTGLSVTKKLQSGLLKEHVLLVQSL